MVYITAVYINNHILFSIFRQLGYLANQGQLWNVTGS